MGLLSCLLILNGKGPSPFLPRSSMEVSTSQQFLQWQQFQKIGETLSKITLENNSKFFMHKEQRADAGQEHMHIMHRTEKIYPVTSTHPVLPGPSI